MRRKVGVKGRQRELVADLVTAAGSGHPVMTMISCSRKIRNFPSENRNPGALGGSKVMVVAAGRQPQGLLHGCRHFCLVSSGKFEGKTFFAIKAGILIFRAVSMPWESEADLTGGRKVFFDHTLPRGAATCAASHRKQDLPQVPRRTRQRIVPCQCHPWKKVASGW